jgi:hypothetical protein
VRHTARVLRVRAPASPPPKTHTHTHPFPPPLQRAHTHLCLVEGGQVHLEHSVQAQLHEAAQCGGERRVGRVCVCGRVSCVCQRVPVSWRDGAAVSAPSAPPPHTHTKHTRTQHTQHTDSHSRHPLVVSRHERHARPLDLLGLLRELGVQPGRVWDKVKVDGAANLLEVPVTCVVRVRRARVSCVC